MFQEQIINSIRKIMNDRHLTQVAMADYMNTSESQFSKILSGKVQLSLKQLSNLARGLSVREIDIITYPDVYVKISSTDAEQVETEPIEAILQIKLKKDKKDQVLRLVFGDNDIEILNK